MKTKLYFIALAIACMTAMQALSQTSTGSSNTENNCKLIFFDENEPDEDEWEKDEDENEPDENENEKDENEPDEDEWEKDEDENEPDENEYGSLLSLIDEQATDASQFDQHETGNDEWNDSTYQEGTEIFDEESYYDDERDAELDSLRQMVSELQSSVRSTEEALAESEEDARNKAIWNDRAKYFNIYYVNQSLTQKDIDGTWNNDYGVALAMGKTFYLHKQPILGMIKFGIDWSYFDINFSKYSDKWGFFNGDAESGMGNNYWYENEYGYDYGYGTETEDVYQAEVGMALGVSVTVNPYDHIKAAGYFRVVPSYSMLYAAEDFSGSYGTFFLAGGSVSYKVISLGIEGRWGTAKYDSVINVSDLGEGDVNLDGNYNGSSKWKTGSVRFYIGFRF